MVKKTLEPGVMGLISINPPHTGNIFDKHKKFIEWRTFPLPLGRYAVYETKRNGGSGKVIGEFRVCDYTEYLSIDAIAPVSIMLGHVSKVYLKKYAKGKPLYENLLCAVKKYDTPKELDEFKPPCIRNCEKCKYSKWLETFDDYGCAKQRLKAPPQSWRRVKEVED